MTKRKRNSSQYRKNKRTQQRVGTSSTLGRRSSSSSNSSNISALARYSSQVAGGTLGFIAGDVPGAVAGAVYAGRAYDLFNPPRNVLPKNNMAYAGYGGKLNKYQNGRDSMQKALQIGGVSQVEQFGLVRDSHCVYIGHSTYSRDQIGQAVRYALIRKVCMKAGLRVINRFEELPLFIPGNSDGFKLEYVYGNSLTGNYLSTSYITVDNDSLTSVTQNFSGFTNLLNDYLAGADDKQPFSINIYASDRNVTDTNWRFAGGVQISDEEMHCQISSVIKVQNRTAGDSAGAGDLNTERTDCQPVVVKGYSFMNGDPRTRALQGGLALTDGNYSVLNGTPINNVRLLRSTDFGVTNVSFQNQPPKGIFANCSKVSTTILQPGSMKQSSIFYTFKGRGHNFFKKLQFHLNTSNQIFNVYGRYELLVFEEKMRTVGTNPVSIHYERKYSVGVYCLTKKGGTIVPAFGSSELNLL